MRKSRLDSTASCGNANLALMSAERVQSLACSDVLFSVFWFSTATVEVKSGGRQSTCSAFTAWFRKAYWKVLTARTSLILEELVLRSMLLAALCVLLHSWYSQAFFCDQQSIVSALTKNGAEKKKRNQQLFSLW